MNRFMRRQPIGAFAIALVIIAHAIPTEASAQRSLQIKSFDADYVVQRDGTLSVTERITAQFAGSWNGLYRQIPIRYRMTNGTDYLIALKVRSATDEFGNSLRTEEEREGSYLKIKAWIPNANNATHTLILTYDVDNALRFFDEHVELYWNVTGSAWDFPLEAVRARVTLPSGANGIRTAAYTGPEGSYNSDATVTQNGTISEFTVSRPLQLRENMTIVLGWNPGAVERPSRFDKFAHLVKSNALMALPFLFLLLMYLVWRKWGHDPAIGTIVTRYEPPPGLSAAEVGTMIDMSVDNRDVAATLVDLAVRGHIRINEIPRPKLLGLDLGSEYTIERLTPIEQDKDLRDHERLMMKGLFSAHRDLVSMKDLRNSFYKTLSEIQSSLWTGMMKAGYFQQDPKTVRASYSVLAIVTFIGVLVLGGYLAVSQGIAEDTIYTAAILSAAPVAVFGWLMPRRTIRGIQMVREVMGFQEFLSRVEGERMRTVIQTPELFEKYLPFAIALGVDEQWASKFASLSMEPPQWYTGSYHGAFNSHLFVGHVNRMTTSVGTTFASSPRSSSGSGFSGGGGGGGGGFSGGGFGGGGGGGF